MFSLPHIIIIIFTAILVPIYCNHLKNCDRAHIDNFFKVSAVCSVMLLCIYWVWEYIEIGFFHWETTLPLYLCSLFAFCLPIAVFTDKKSFINRIALSNAATMGFAGGVLGLIFNVYLDMHPFFSFVPLRSLSYHIVMILVSTALWATKYYRPKKGDEYLCFIPLLILMIPAIALRIAYGWNYLYTANMDGTPIAFLNKYIPNPVLFIALYSFLWFCLRLIFFRKTCYKILKLKDRTSN